MHEANHLHMCAVYLLEAVAVLELDDLFLSAMPDTWRQGQRLLRSESACDQLVGHRIMLAAITATPNGAQALVEALERGLAGHAS